MADAFILPNVCDFRKFGRFYHIQNLDIYHDLPNEILYYIFPLYIFIKDKINKQFILKLKDYCIYLKNTAEYEDYIEDLSDKKELLLRRLEDKLRSEIIKK